MEISRLRAELARPLDASGSRGAVELAPGVFHCSAALVLAASGVVLRGAGSGAAHDATTISQTGDPHAGIIIKNDFVYLIWPLSRV